jgi:hypothetical protein
VPTSALIAGFVLCGFLAIVYVKMIPKPMARVPGAKVEDLSEKKLVIESDPTGADVWIQDQRMGVTPYQADNDYSFGAKMDLKVRKMGMVDVATKFAGGRGQKVSVVLAPPPDE